MGKMNKKDVIEKFLEHHPNATETEIFKEIHHGKLTFTKPYVRKVASLWRKRQHEKRSPEPKQSRSKKQTPTSPSAMELPSDMDAELRNILGIMLHFNDSGIRVQFREIHEYLKDRGSITQAEEEIKSQTKLISTQELVSLISQRKKRPEELLDDS